MDTSDMFFLLTAACWGVPTIIIMSLPAHLERFKLSKKEICVIWWIVGIGYPLGLIFFIKWLKS